MQLKMRVMAGCFMCGQPTGRDVVALPPNSSAAHDAFFAVLDAACSEDHQFLVGSSRVIVIRHKGEDVHCNTF